MREMKYIICGPLIPEEVENFFYSFSPAAGKFVRNMEMGLNENGRETCGFAYITNPFNEGGYEHLKNYTAPVKYHIYTAKNSGKLSFVKFQNDLLKCVDQDTVVIIYNMGYSYFSLVHRIKQKGGKACILIADYSEVSEMKSVPRKIHAWLCQREFMKFDYAIVLTRNLKKKLSGHCKTLFIPGGIDLRHFQQMKKPIRGDKLIYMYAGLLSTVTGVDVLLRAIKLCKLENIEFWFSGKGDLQEQVCASAKTDSRIKYLGFMSENDYFPTLAKVNVFINPRNMSLQQNKNNFPSKVLEYLATGRMVISTKFSEYRCFMENFILYDGTEKELADAIEKTYDEYDSINEEYYDVNRRKALNYSWEGIAKQIIDFFEIEGENK